MNNIEDIHTEVRKTAESSGSAGKNEEIDKPKFPFVIPPKAFGGSVGDATHLSKTVEDDNSIQQC